MTTVAKACPKCFRPETEMETCGNFVIGCPPPVEVTPENTVIVDCGPCKRQLYIPIGNVMKKRLNEVGNCQRQDCCATVVPPTPTAAVKDAAKKLFKRASKS